MTLGELVEALRRYAEASPLAFATPAGEAGPGYHVTEFRAARSTAIDCGGTVSILPEARMQLLDGVVGEPMTVARFLAIAGKSLDRVPGLGEAELLVEFAHGNLGLELYSPGPPVAEGARVTVPLRAARAVCRPVAQRPGAATGCCSRAAEIPVTGDRCCGGHVASPAAQSA